MKRSFITLSIALVAMLAGCSSQQTSVTKEIEYVYVTSIPEKVVEYVYVTSSPAPTEAPTTTPTPTVMPTPTPTAIPTVAPATAKDSVDEKEDKDYEVINVTVSNKDNMFTGTYVKIEAEPPYFVGEQESSFLKTYKDNYDEVLYLTARLYVGKGEHEVSDDTIVEIDSDGFVNPLKQGLVTIDGVRYAVTTSNDGRDCKSVRFINKSEASACQYVGDAETWRDKIKSITDMITYLTYRNFTYTNIEPNTGWYGDGWMWNASGESIHDYNYGVCATVAQLANYMLAGDFEDWGNINISGAGGHIFNYFIEDGKYYCMDFTKVISSLSDGDYSKRAWVDRDNETFIKDLQSEIEVYNSFEEMKEILAKRCVAAEGGTVAVYAVSCLGHDYYPLVHNTQCSHDWDWCMRCSEGKEELVIYFEKEAMEGVRSIWTADKVTFGTLKEVEIPMFMRTIDTCCYGYHLEKVR